MSKKINFPETLVSYSHYKFIAIKGLVLSVTGKTCHFHNLQFWIESLPDLINIQSKTTSYENDTFCQSHSAQDFNGYKFVMII